MIVGVDVSSRRIDLAWLENGKPQRWHQELGGPKTHLIDRLRSIRIQWPIGDDWDATEIAIEMPFTRSGNSFRALGAVLGIVTHQAPPWARVAWPSSGELRAAIGAKNTKEAVIPALYELATEKGWLGTLFDWDEHELDALVAAVGWAQILNQQEAAP